MAKLTLAPLVSGFSDVEVFNSNMEAIAAAIENTLSRDGSAPNSMAAQLDMNSRRIINVGAGTNNNDAATFGQLQAISLNYVVQRRENQDTVPAQATYTLQDFTYQPGQNNLAVYREGIRLRNDEYVETSPTAITLVDVPVGVESLQFVVNESLGTFGDIPAHSHQTADILDLASSTIFDARYYTETEVDAALGLKANLTTPTFTGQVSFNSTVRRKNADNANYVSQPRIFVQASDPGTNAADGDIWMW